MSKQRKWRFVFEGAEQREGGHYVDKPEANK
ncbi:hypothetical protein EC841_10154 [Raoultella ornithinolytica]|jgi:hypothetical protein|uniref:Uncharacterized protein n=2 Tax=Raoultella TaxID=160674 RepID=A0ABD7QNI8_RAOOR|nr:hypothetical protein [Raoultella sp. BIGb0132]MCS4288510.1 hypothetical protein [Raoultella terrigena]TCQ76245.1 hypothetical protein EC841_10154 [Raoultella ornithinolytica]ROS20933.1 hypothetical protein EDF79_3492 [Raoultella terrigena]VED49500.1 Uncharacterised protein [Raoultella terrigena]